jgi:hypothetical protein
MPESSITIPPTWHENISIGEVMRAASEACEVAMIVFICAEGKRDVRGMEEQVKVLRHVATRLDQDRRMKEKQWTAAASAISKRESPHT